MLWSNSQVAAQGFGREKVDRNMLPLINIIFLLLAFFVLAGQIEAHHRKFSVPKSTSDIERSNANQVLVVFADGSLELDGHVVEREELRGVLGIAESSQLVSDLPAIQVVADAELLVDVLQETLNELMELGITKINLATLKVDQHEN